MRLPGTLALKAASRSRLAAVGCAVAVALAPAAALANAPSEKPLSLAEKKAVVLAAPPEIVRMLGGHVMIGYFRASQLIPLLERGAIGGVFVTRRNAKRRSIARIAREIRDLRDTARGNTTRPLWIATDQEGGLVAHMTPPLKRQTSLSRALGKAGSREERREVVQDFADLQGAGLSQIGINLNFAPVVDLKPKKKLRRDRRTHLIRRAISDDPDRIIEAAETYCNTLAGWRILCTLKHFPGLQGADADTHISEAVLQKSRQELEQSDWMPFWSLTSTTPAAIMVGHAQLADLEAGTPASASKTLLTEVLRSEWNYDGLIITDDLNMGAVNKRPGGIGRAAVDSLQAGADILLLTHDGDVVYEILYGLLQAYQRGQLDLETLSRSRARLDRHIDRFDARQITWPEDLPLPAPAPHRAASAE